MKRKPGLSTENKHKVDQMAEKAISDLVTKAMSEDLGHLEIVVASYRRGLEDACAILRS